MKSPRRIMLFTLLLSLPCVPAAAENEQVSLTVYQDGTGLIKHRRSYDLSSGENTIRLDRLGDQMQLDTVLVRHGANPSYLSVLELAYRDRPLTPQSLLQAHVGRQVKLIRTHPLSDADQQVEAELLSIAGGPVLRVGDTIETAAPGRIAFDSIPAELTLSPQLEVRLVSQDSGQQPVEISYLSSGFGWSADYVAEIDPDGGYISLDAWAAIRNATSAGLDNAIVRLVSGEPNRVRPEPRRRVMAESARMALADNAAEPSREVLGDYHLYSLPRRASLAAGETRRVALLSARQVPVDTLYQVRAQAPHLYQSRYAAPEQALPVARLLRAQNRVAHNLGQPLPTGVIRLYQRDRNGEQQLVGEDRLQHTPVDQPIELRLGSAFDLSARKEQLDFAKLPAEGVYRNAYSSEFRIRLANSKDHAVEIEVIENLPGDWKIESESHPHERVNAAEASWRINLPPGEDRELRYRARIRF